MEIALIHHGNVNQQYVDRVAFLESRVKEYRGVIERIQDKILQDPSSEESLSMEDLIRLSEIDTVVLCRCLYEVYEIVMLSDQVSMPAEVRSRLAGIFRNGSSF